MPKVLLLEDLDSDAGELEAALKQIGDYELQRFRVASQAIESLSDALEADAELPALIIADLNLPDSSGYELLRFYHANAALNDVPIAVWSVLDSDADRKLTKWMGSRKLISKNSGPAALRKSLASLLQISTPPKP
jgi:DNA-binding response OmpR family regulator